jgi:putative hydrolase of the HAD superfamily
VIRAVFFDVGGTLVRPWPSVGAVYSNVGSRFGFDASADAMERAFREAWKTLKSDKPGTLTTSDKQWWRALVFEALASLKLPGSEEARDAYFAALYDAFAQPAAWQIYPEVVATIQACRSRGRHVGVISNWDQRLRPLLAKLGLGPMFDSLTISCEVGAEKPDPKMFHAALRAAGVEAAEALHVGDALDEDIKAAENVGMRGIWIDRRDESASLLNLVSQALFG